MKTHFAVKVKYENEYIILYIEKNIDIQLFVGMGVTQFEDVFQIEKISMALHADALQVRLSDLLCYDNATSKAPSKKSVIKSMEEKHWIYLGIENISCVKGK